MVVSGEEIYETAFFEMTRITIPIFAYIVLLLAGPAAATEFFFDPGNAVIQGKIKYAAIGTYTAEFKKFEGMVVYDDEMKMIKAVDLKIDAASIHSRHAKLDRIVRSKRILDVQQYPGIFFYSKDIQQQGEKLFVTGILNMHGIKREMSFPFQFSGPGKNSQGDIVLQVQGKWIIQRKDFEVIWSKILDHGGIIIGNHVAIDWQIKAAASKGGI